MDGPDEHVVVASRRIQHFAVLALAGLVTVQLPLPWAFAAPAFSIVAVVVGVRAVAAARKARMRGLVMVAVSTGIGLAAVIVMSFASVVALWPLQLELQECERGALTISAEHQCRADFQQGVEERLTELLGSPSG
ncbi:hypothetical protein OEB99_14195 [Actinotalea sp. M2MS4P-6]|uniref:hypothetical protein n=1 Tax=Actinotalea sp. M2MS4P-6 TaxID=2983762 RepID=UPI0021E50E42|nr:hypothetical protein [Actinotalea sp. M2MS4P-6]MCV2395464.1 hypothetical protein [Actinotalea sp. M2MS4P-6]